MHAVYAINKEEVMLDRLVIIGELFAFLWKRKLWWLIPMIAVFILFGTLLLLAGSSPVIPLIYPLF